MHTLHNSRDGLVETLGLLFYICKSSEKGAILLEIWKPLRNFPSYNGSSEGRIMNVRTQRILKTFINEKGYEKVCLRKNNQQHTVSVHKVIAETFLGEHPGMDVRHKDLDRSNNRVDNLEWCTRAETIASAYARGTKRPRQSSKT